MADPITLAGSALYVNGETIPRAMSIALTDASGGQEVDATSDNITQTDVFTVQQKEMLALAPVGTIDVNANAVTGTPDVTLIAERTNDPTIASTTNWHEIGRARLTGSALPLNASITITGPCGYMTNFIRVRADSTGGALAAGNKFTANAVASATVPASAIHLTR